jgi:hypothetical protein
MRKHSCWTISLVLLSLPFLAVQADAGLASIEEASEVMMNSEGLLGVAIGFTIGSDNMSPLSFTSSVDPVAQTFSYASLPSSSYLGQPVAITG